MIKSKKSKHFASVKRQPALLEALEIRRLLTTITVGPDGDYTTLSAALDASDRAVPPGSTVEVAPGTYASTDQEFFIGKALTIESTGAATLTVTGSPLAVIEVSADNVSISGFTLEGGANGVDVQDFLDTSHVITGTSLSNLTVSSPATSGSGTGIVLTATANSNISNCTVAAGFGSGIYLDNGADNNTIAGNTINGTAQDGITLTSNCNGNSVTDNTINNSGGNGVTAAGAMDNWIEGNTLNNSSTAGIYVRDSGTGNQILNNTINGTGSQNGIQINANNTIVADNDIINAFFDGIQISDADNNQVYDNTLTSPGVDGITATSSANYNYIGQNQITFTQRADRTANGAAGSGVWLNQESNFNWIFDNSINSASENAISVFHSGNNLIQGNTTFNDQLGGLFSTNSYGSGDSGPNNDPTDNVIVSNYFYKDATPGYVNLEGTDQTLVQQNFMDGTGQAGTTGVILNGATDTQVEENIIKNMGGAFYLYADSADSLITRNRIFNPGSNYSISGTSVAWDAGPVMGGNFWSDETGVSGNPSSGSTPYDKFIYDNTGLFNGPYADRYPFQLESLGTSGDVTLMEPLAGTTLAPGSERTIAWDSSAAIYVDITLNAPNGSSTTIASGAPNTGLYNWIVPANMAAAAGYTIAVTPLDSSGNTIGNAATSGALTVTDTSTNSLQLLTPSRATMAGTGSSLRVSWLSTGVSQVNVQLQTDGGTWTTLASNVSGNFTDVTLPSGVSSDDAVIRIEDAQGNASDTMDGVFTIAGGAAFTASPQGTAAVGSLQPLKWLSPSGAASVSLAYTDSAGTHNVFSNLTDTGSFTWIVPDANAPQAQLQLTFYDSSGNALGTASSPTFDIPGQGNAIVYNNGTGGGGGGGGNGASATLSTSVSAKFTGNLVGGSKTKITGSVSVTNSTPQVFNATVPVALYLSTSSNALDGSGAIVSKSEKLKLNAHQTKKIPLAFTVPAGLAQGTYYLFAEATPSDGEALSAAAGPATIAPAFVDLSLTNLTDVTPIVQGSKTKPKITFTIANGGNVAAKGKATLTLFASTTGNTDSETQLSQILVPVNLKANGGTKSFSVSPIIFAGLVAAGDYTLIGVLSAPSGENEPSGDLANNTDIGTSVAIS